MDPSPLPDLVVSQVTYATLVVMVVQWLKKTRFAPFISYETDVLNKMIAALLAAVAAVGIHVQYDGSAHTLLLTGFSFVALGHGLWHFFQSFAFQEVIYHGALKPAVKVPLKPLPPLLPPLPPLQ